MMNNIVWNAEKRVMIQFNRAKISDIDKFHENIKLHAFEFLILHQFALIENLLRLAKESFSIVIQSIIVMDFIDTVITIGVANGVETKAMMNNFIQKKKSEAKHSKPELHRPLIQQ